MGSKPSIPTPAPPQVQQVPSGPSPAEIEARAREDERKRVEAETARRAEAEAEAKRKKDEEDRARKSSINKDVTGIYKELLDRDPTSAELERDVDVIYTGKTSLAELRKGIEFSDEATRVSERKFKEDEAGQKERSIRRNTVGRRSSILTSPEGLLDVAPTGKKTLLGGN